ncbi:toxin-antitoxin system, antitoxin component, Xre domain protein [delta proteobacterium NaphS2]|nr:toxin-antitoxin system, antitoxin component, Xre domain protein [delta proteobacterium NaphS2]
MTHADIFAEWQKLCDEHAAVRDAHFKALAAVNQKFVAIGQGQSNIRLFQACGGAKTPTANITKNSASFQEIEPI